MELRQAFASDLQKYLLTSHHLKLTTQCCLNLRLGFANSMIFLRPLLVPSTPFATSSPVLQPSSASFLAPTDTPVPRSFVVQIVHICHTLSYWFIFLRAYIIRHHCSSSRRYYRFSLDEVLTINGKGYSWWTSEERLPLCTPQALILLELLCKHHLLGKYTPL